MVEELVTSHSFLSSHNEGWNSVFRVSVLSLLVQDLTSGRRPETRKQRNVVR